MKHYTVLLRSAKEAAALVDLVSLCPGAAELCVGEDRMDAKSFMGVLGVAMGRKAVLKIPGEGGALLDDWLAKNKAGAAVTSR